MKYVFILVSIMLVLVGCGESAQPSAPIAPTQPVSTHAPTTSVPALLGSPLATFIALYGAANDHSNAHSGEYHFKRYADVSVATDALIVNVDTTDGTTNVIGVQFAPEKGSATCEQFFPRDAHFERQVNAPTGLDKIYSSSSLTSIFPKSAFSDVDNNDTTPGLFDELVSSGECVVHLGTMQTA